MQDIVQEPHCTQSQYSAVRKITACPDDRNLSDVLSSVLSRIHLCCHEVSDLKRVLFLALLMCSMLAMAPLAQAADDRLTLSGSSTMAPLLLEIAKRYENLHPSVRINVQTGGSSRGINDARMGMADIGMVSRALKESEQDLTQFMIAMDSIGIIVHRSNTVTRLSDQQIIAIYTGEVSNWQVVGGPDLQISVINKAEGRSTLELFLKHFALKNSQIKAQVVIGDNQQAIKTVTGNPGAIGYVSIGSAEYEIQRGTPIKLLLVKDPSTTVASGAPHHDLLTRQLNLVVKGQPAGLSIDFIQFAQSPAVADLITAQFFIAP